jgi:hypothetical protein
MIEALTTTALIFGGCCTNVFALESILKTEPNSGMPPTNPDPLGDDDDGMKIQSNHP